MTINWQKTGKVMMVLIMSAALLFSIAVIWAILLVNNDAKYIASNMVEPHEYICDTRVGTVTFTAPIEPNISETLTEMYEEGVCNSISINTDIQASESDAKCDTDTNCMLYDIYKSQGVSNIFVYDYDDDTLIVTCDDGRRKVTYDNKLDVACGDPSKIVEKLDKESDNSITGSIGFSSLDVKQLHALMAAGKVDLDKQTAGNHTNRDFLHFIEKHPDILVEVWYRSDKATEHISEVLGTDCSKGTKCFNDNSGLTIVGINAYNYDYIPSWLADFCEGSEVQLSTDDMSCWWDN
jgi:hypothetical protein